MLLHEIIQVILVLVNTLQEVGSLKLQPVQLLIHLAGGGTTVRVRQNDVWEGLVHSKEEIVYGCVR